MISDHDQFQAKVTFLLEGLQSNDTEDALFSHFCRLQVSFFKVNLTFTTLRWPPHSHPHPPYYHHHHHYHQLSHTFGIKNFVSLSIFFASFPSSFSSSSSSFSSASPSAVYERSTLPHLSWAPACLQVSCQHIIR